MLHTFAFHSLIPGGGQLSIYAARSCSTCSNTKLRCVSLSKTMGIWKMSRSLQIQTKNSSISIPRFLSSFYLTCEIVYICRLANRKLWVFSTVFDIASVIIDHQAISRFQSVILTVKKYDTCRLTALQILFLYIFSCIYLSVY